MINSVDVSAATTSTSLTLQTEGARHRSEERRDRELKRNTLDEDATNPSGDEARFIFGFCRYLFLKLDSSSSGGLPMPWLKMVVHWSPTVGASGGLKVAEDDMADDLGGRQPWIAAAAELRWVLGRMTADSLGRGSETS